MSPKLEHLTSVDRDLTATFYRAARALPDVPPPTEEDLDAIEHLDLFGNCGRCVSPAQHFPEITVEEARAANAANPRRLFPVRPRKAQTFPESNACYCDHVDQSGYYAWPAYGAWLERKAAQAALRAAYNKVCDLWPQLRGLIAERWIDREAVLLTLAGASRVARAIATSDDCEGADEQSPKGKAKKEPAQLDRHDVQILRACYERRSDQQEIAKESGVSWANVKKRTASLQEAGLLECDHEDGGWIRTREGTRELERRGLLSPTSAELKKAKARDFSPR